MFSLLVLDAIYNSGVKGKLYRLLYMMNKNPIIKVKTGVGMTEEESTGENIGHGQGTGEGVIISAASIADGVDTAFEHSGQENMKPLLFQDDIARICDSIENAQYGNDRVTHVMETKLLDFNLDKSCFMDCREGENQK